MRKINSGDIKEERDRNMSQKVLEFDKIIARVAANASSEMGKALVFELQPSDDYETIKQWQAETEEAANMIYEDGNPPLGVIYDAKHSIKTAMIGGVLSAKHLLQIVDTLRSCRRIKTYLLQKESSFPYMNMQATRICNYPALEKEIERCIIGEELISDHASPALYKIRQTLEQKKSNVRKRLDQLVASPDMQRYLQDGLVTIRNDRFVLPVKSEHRSNVQGLIHDQSAKGGTVYVEPMAVVHLNNEIKQLELEEQTEIRIILQSLSGQVGEVGDAILNNTQIVAQLDAVFARGKYAVETKAIRPEIADNQTLVIRNGRHPLIDPTTVVPLNITLGNEFTTLLITGPNTGGKTVALKTVGLLTLMAQSGLHVPADHGTSLSIFDKVYADIGDEQSIEQSLSTFSSHMKNIVQMLDHVTNRSLVLFDELGAGTDPTEGAALAIAILDTMRKRGVRTMATTHYAELKHYALAKHGVENASMVFDIETLSPTYRMIIGIPGKSNAFEICKKLGLDEFIIDQARENISTESADFETILAKVEESRRLAEQERDKAVQLRVESDALKKKWEQKTLTWTSQREEQLQRSKKEARDILKKAKLEADALAKQLRKIKDGSALSEVDRARQSFSDHFDELNEPVLNQSTRSFAKDHTVLQVGDQVLLTTLNKEATILSISSDEKTLELLMGSMKMKAERRQVIFVKREKKKHTATAHVSSSRSIQPEKDVRGQHVEEAILEIDKYIDDVMASSLEKVTIIHGKGTGLLRKGLHDYFKHHPFVKSFQLAPPNQGGSGATVIEVKK